MMNQLKMKSTVVAPAQAVPLVLCSCNMASLQILTKIFVYKANKISKGLFVSEEFYFTMKVNTGAENSHKLRIFQLNINSALN